MPKKTRPITVLTAEESDALDEATFAELAEDEECLHQALEDPSTSPEHPQDQAPSSNGGPPKNTGRSARPGPRPNL